MTSVFLSHSSRDKEFVRKLAKELDSYGIRIWLDEAEINIGDSLIDKIGEAIDETDFVGVVLSNNSINSEWVQRELNLAINKEFKIRKVVVLPILLESVEIPPFLRDKLYADFTNSERIEAGLLKLLKTLGVSSTIARKGIKQRVKRLGHSSATSGGKAATDTVTTVLNTESTHTQEQVSMVISQLNEKLGMSLGHVVDFEFSEEQVIIRMENETYCRVFRLAISEFRNKTIDEITDYMISEFGG